MEITADRVVLIHYTLKDDKGAVIDSSAGGEPLAYIQGHGNLVPGLEKALEGKEDGNTLAVSVAPADGYGTGYIVYVLRQAGMPTDAEPIRKGVAWLKSHQRVSGRWFTRSPSLDHANYLTHAGTGFAIMALAACGEK